MGTTLIYSEERRGGVFKMSNSNQFVNSLFEVRQIIYFLIYVVRTSKLSNGNR